MVENEYPSSCILEQSGSESNSSSRSRSDSLKGSRADARNVGFGNVPRIRGKYPSLALVSTVIHFEQYVYQGLWIEDSPLKQLPHIGDRVSIER